jgi:hypothetical protein
MNPHQDSTKGRMRMISDLKLVNELIELFGKHEWIRGCNAIKGIDHGDTCVCKPTDPDATGFCLRGGAIKVLAPDNALLASAFIMDSLESKQIPRALGFKMNNDVVAWNDDEERTLTDILALLYKRRDEIPAEEAKREEEAKKKAAAALAKNKAQHSTAPTRGKRKKASAMWLDYWTNIQNKENGDD